MRTINSKSRFQILALATFALAFAVFANDAAAQEYHARDEFALTQGGTTGVWNYGYSPSDTDHTFTQYPQNRTVSDCAGSVNFEEWNISTGATPVIARNDGLVRCQNVPPELLFFHPSPSGQRSVLRWTAPAAGSFLLNGVIQKVDPNATSNLKILKNVTEPALFSGDLDSATSQQAFSFTVTVAAGDTIDFSVGWGNGSFNNDGSGLAVTISQPVTACLTQPANQTLWLPGENSTTDIESVNTNASLVGDAFYTNAGKVGRAFNFDGAGDYVTVDDNPAHKPINQLTVEGWFKLNSLSGLPHLVSKPLRNSPFNSYALWFDNGNIRIGYYQTNQSFNFYDTGFVPQTDVWYHYAFVLNTDDTGPTANTQKLFVNGVEVFSGVAGNPIFYNGINDAFAPYPLLIGADFESNTPSFFLNGQADEVSIYSRALTQPELFNLTKQGSFGKCLPPNCVQPPSSLVSWYQGENNAIDSRSSNHGTMQNGTVIANGKVGQAFSFDGIDDKVVVPNSPSLDITGNQLTIEAWINLADTAGFHQIVSMATGTAQPAPRKYGLFVDPGGTLGFEVNTTNGYGNAPPSGTIPVGTFTHVAGVYNGTQMIWYINGNVAGTFNLSGNIVPSVGDFVIGQFATSGASPFKGLIDEVAVYNRALSQTELQSIVAAGQGGKCKPSPLNPTTNQIVWLTGDGDARDFQGEDQNGTINGATFGIGKVGQAFQFDGVNDNVEIPDSPALNPTGAITLETWVKATGGQGTDRDIISKDGETSARQYFLVLGNTDRFRAHVTTNTGLQFFNGATTITLNTWTHVAMTYDGTMLSLYVNGFLDGQLAVSGAIIQTTQPFRIGGGAPTGQLQLFFTGLIDEASLYDRALSPAELAAIYNAGVAGKLKEKPTVVNAPTVVQLGDATVTFAQVNTAGTTSQAGLDLGLLPPLPAGTTFTGLAYDLSTTATFTSATVCFNLPSINSQPTFSQLKVLHLESGTWVDRTTGQHFPSRTLCGQVSSFSPFAIATGSTPTAGGATISGQVTTPDGTPLGGVLVTLSGAKSAWTLTDSSGNYHFDSVDTVNFYTVTPALANYSFSPANRSFSLLGNKTDAVFTAFPHTTPVGNAIDTSEYFVRQQYLDFLGREPDQGGLEYWNNEIARCGNDPACVNKRRIDVSAAFFMAKEFQETGSFVYGLYKASFGNQPSYQQFITDRAKVVSGTDLDARKNALADEWVQRDSFRQAYPDSMTTEQFVNKLFESAGLVSQTGEWETYVLTLNNGGTRAQVLRSLTESHVFTAKEYNAAFVLMEYFAYLLRDPDPGGYAFWLDVLNYREPDNFRGMVCAFITSTEYQQRFSSVVTHSNAECAR